MNGSTVLAILLIILFTLPVDCSSGGGRTGSSPVGREGTLLPAATPNIGHSGGVIAVTGSPETFCPPVSDVILDQASLTILPAMEDFGPSAKVIVALRREPMGPGLEKPAQLTAAIPPSPATAFFLNQDSP